jgi:hypothetical protein
MGTPWMAFFEDEFKWSRNSGAISFGLAILILGMPTVVFFEHGVFDEYDYWAGTVSLFVFSLIEAILFAWVFGMDKGWRELHKGADMNIPVIYKFIIKYITPTFLLFIFLFNLITPQGGDVANAISNIMAQGWTLDDSSIIKQLFNSGLRAKIKNAPNEQARTVLEDRLFYVNLARFILLSVFLFLCFLVYKASVIKEKLKLK